MLKQQTRWHIGRLVVCLVGAYLSGQYVTTRVWPVGLTFGAVVLVWRAHSFQELCSLRSALFLVASTLIYPGVFWLVFVLSGPERHFHLALAIGVAAGTVLLPIAHGLLLNVARRRVIIAIPGIYGLWLLAFFSIDKLPVIFEDGLPVLVYLWQAAYLLCMFAPPPKPKPAAVS